MFGLPILWKLTEENDFQLADFWTGSAGYTRLPNTVHHTRILSPNIASLASLNASVAILDSHRSLGYFESTLATEVRLWPAFSISEESRTFVFEFLNGNGSGSESLVDDLQM